MKTSIRLLGTSFVLHSDQESEYIQMLLDYISSQLDVVKNDVECSDPLKSSIMVNLLIAHELFELKKTLREEDVQTSNVAKKLITMLEEELDTDAEC